MNVVILIGRLVAQPELKYTQANVAVCSFRLAVDRRFKDQSGNKQTDFIDCVAWRQQAEFMTNYLEKGKLNKRTVVGTKMTNLGVEKALCEKGIFLSRVDVGDKYINEELEKKCLFLGAEQSGHILMKDRHSTGDGILSALVVTEICKEKKKNLSQFFDFEKYKQTIKNVFVKNRDEVFESEELKNEIEKQNKLLKSDGRILVRKSGTEPLIRIMVESKDEKLNNKIAEDIVQVINDKVN